MITNKLNTHAYFSLAGDNFSPEKVSEGLTIKASEFWQIGDKGKYEKRFSLFCSKLSNENGNEYFNINMLVSEIVHQLKDKV